MQMLKKLFNSDNKFHLELDEIKESEVVQNAVKTASKATEAVKEKASEVVDSQPVKEALAKTKDVLDSDESDEVKADTKSQSKLQANEQKVAEAKPKQNGKQKETEKKAETTAREASGASSYEPPFWVAAMYNNSSKNNNGRIAEETFATDNLMPIATKYRRRPGGSLKKFKDMAKQAKTPKG